MRLENGLRARLVGVFGLVVFWELLALILRVPALPGPARALVAFLEAIAGGLSYHFLISAYRVVLSIAGSFLLAVPLGLFLGREETFDRFLTPVIYLLYPIPKIVFLPVVMILLGLGDIAKIFLISLVLFFQILITTRDAARGINLALIHSVVSLGAGKWDLYRHVIWPAALPEILTSLRIASGTAIAVLFFSETIASQEGLGYYLLDAWTRYAYDQMFAGIMAMGFLGFGLYLALEWAERKLCAWKYL
ncbi:MAG: ABC transporter permease [Firmicutes bacterium]|nr:ABC transporter permease [Bacillota bacterium]MCL5039447.1 ABC transporter permease [Bacillota bacterium]